MRTAATTPKRRGDALDTHALLEQAARTGYTPDVLATLRKAAEAGDCGALNVLGGLHRDGVRGRSGQLQIRRNTRKALEYFRRSAELGDPDGMIGVADTLTVGPFSPRTLAEAEALYRAAFRRGSVTAGFNLACTYQNLGRYREAVHWFRRALAAGDASAGLELARAELYGLGTRRNVASAFARLRGVARRRTRYWPRNTDCIEAMLIMAEALISGWPVRRKFAEGVRWLQRAAKLDSAVATAMLRELGVS